MLAYVGNTMSMSNHLEDCHVEEYRSLKCETDGSKTKKETANLKAIVSWVTTAPTKLR